MTVFAGVLDTKGPSGRRCVTGSTSAEPGEAAGARPRSEARGSAGAVDLRMGMVAGIGSVRSPRPPWSGAAGVKKGCLALPRWAGVSGPRWAGEGARRTVGGAALCIGAAPAPRTARAGVPRRASTAVWRRSGAGKLDKTGVPGGEEVVRAPRRETSGARARRVDLTGCETDGASRLAAACALVARMAPDVSRMVLDVGRMVLDVGRMVLDVGRMVLDGGRMVADASLSITGAAAPTILDGIFAGVTRAIAPEITGDAGAVRPVVAAGEDAAGAATRALPAGPATPCRPVGGPGR